MTIRSTISSLAIISFLTFSLSACGQATKYKPYDKTQSNQNNKLQFDTSKTVIIPFDKKENYPFGNSYKPATLTQTEIIEIDSFIIKCVSDYNASFTQEDKQFRIDLTKEIYKKQLVAVTNEKGEKEVWVNCFCRTWDNAWKTKIIHVDDGGNCYFNFKINLTTKKYYDLGVNAEG